MPIENPIYVYDIEARRRYIFEASMLAMSIRKNLYNQLYTVPAPRRPVNIITNVPFSSEQLMHIYEQLLGTRCRIEDFSIYRRLNFRLETWKQYMRPHLYVSAIREEIMGDTEVGRDMLMDYIIDMMSVRLPSIIPMYSRVLVKAYQWFPSHPLFGELRTLCMKTYEAEYFEQPLHVVYRHFEKAIGTFYPNSELLEVTLTKMVGGGGN